MCACGQPVINGEFGYRWQPDDRPGVRAPAPPTVSEGDTVIWDEPGRCGGLDAHSHHFRVVHSGYHLWLLVRHGGGEERITLYKTVLPALGALDSHGRYWVLHAIYEAHAHARRAGKGEEEARWRRAAAEKRIKVRKVRGQDAVRVTVEG